MNGSVLRRLELGLERLPQQVMQRAAQRVRDYVAQQTALQYATGTDLYGQRWPSPKGGGRPMVRSSHLRSGYVFRLEKTGSGYRVVFMNTADYAGYLQQGTPRMRPRTHVPRGIMPAKWRAGIAAIYQGAFADWRRGV